MSNFIVCPRCSGTGVHDPEAFSNGFTDSDFDDDPEFRSGYFAGNYDVVCSECAGLRVIDPEAELKREVLSLIEHESRCSQCGRQAAFSCAYSTQDYPGAHPWVEYEYYCSSHANPEWVNEHKEILDSLGVL